MTLTELRYIVTLAQAERLGDVRVPLRPLVRDQPGHHPAAGGHGNARSVAAVQTLMANGGVAGGKRLLSEAGVKKALELQIEGHDQVLNMPVRYGMGYGLAGPTRPMPNPNTIFWGGYGGSLVVCDMDARLCMSYVMNKMAGTTVGDMRAVASLTAAPERVSSRALPSGSRRVATTSAAWPSASPADATIRPSAPRWTRTSPSCTRASRSSSTGPPPRERSVSTAAIRSAERSVCWTTVVRACSATM